jgi:tRNA(adenine34) deaminase
MEGVMEMDYVENEDERWMRAALGEAEKAAALGEVPVGAVAVLEGQIIGRGYNRKESDQDPTAHAELIALREAAVFVNNWRLIGVTLYSTLEPCPMCAGAMIQARLPRLVYGAKDLRFGADGSILEVLSEPRFNHRVEVVRGVLEGEAAGLLQRFFRQLREQNAEIRADLTSASSVEPQKGKGFT